MSKLRRAKVKGRSHTRQSQWDSETEMRQQWVFLHRAVLFKTFIPVRRSRFSGVNLGEEGVCEKGRNSRALGLGYRRPKRKREVVCPEKYSEL